MIKKALLIAFALLSLHSIAQRAVSGKVTNGEDNEPLVGVTVLVVGTTNGTITDFDGMYTLNNVPDGASIRYSYTGFQEQVVVVGNQSTIDIAMSAGVALNEVVVTALGVSREKKALGYSVTEVDGGNFTQARENNIANALTGRVAGVNVSKVSSGPGGSSRVIIRGNKSLAGNNQPLYVIDGVPMDNSGFGQAGLWGGADEGDGMSSINPDDIETITVLKGANAAALYGARAANGVINIITKRGSNRKGIGVEFNSNYVFETLNDLSDLQQSYGSGGFTGALPNGVATKPTRVQDQGWFTQAWGPKFDGSSVVQFDGVARPYSQTQNKFDAFYQTGTSLTNSLAFTGGNDKQSFRLGLSDLRGTSILPKSGFDRTNVSLAANSKFGKKLTLDAKVLYSLENNKNRPTLSDSPGNAVQSVWKVPGNIDVTSLRGDPNKPGAIPATGVGADVLAYWGRVPGEEWQLNPVGDQWSTGAYWGAYQFINSDKRDRVNASGRLRYDITSWLYAEGQVGLDKYNRRGQGLTPQGTGYSRPGSITEDINRVEEINATYTIGFPSFKNVKIQIPNQKPILIKSTAALKPEFVSSFSINGRATTNYFKLKAGDHLHFQLDAKSYKINREQQKNSETNYLVRPYVSLGNRVFKDSTIVRLASLYNNPIEYCFDTTTNRRFKFLNDLVFKTETRLYFRNQSTQENAEWLYADFIRKPQGMQLKLQTSYANQYPASGNDALIDGLQGSMDFRDGLWQGYQGKDIQLLLEFSEERDLNYLGIRFLQDQGPWILMPTQVEFKISEDGKHFESLDLIRNQISQKEEGAIVHEFNTNQKFRCRFVQIKAKNAGPLPDWHQGAGGASWLFTDEIVIK